MSKLKNIPKSIGGFIKKHKILSVILIAIIVVAIFVVVKINSTKSKMPQISDSATLTTTVEKMDLQSSISVTGTLAAKDTVSVTSTLTGVKVESINYEVGDYVNAGDVVVNMDGDDLEEKLANLDESNSIENFQTAHSIESYQKQIADIEEYLEEYKYVYESLVKYYNARKDSVDAAAKYEEESKGAEITIDQYEQKQDSLEDAKYNLELALKKQKQSKGQQEDNYQAAKDDISDTQITSPISGYITAINVEEGNNYTQGSTIFTVADTSGFEVTGTVDEYDIFKLSKGLRCVVKFDATDDEEFEGELTYVAVSSSASSSTSASSSMGASTSSSGYSIKITLKDTNENLRAGMTAKAAVILDEEKDALAVPYDCVETAKDGSSYVVVVDGDNETKVTVTTGLESDYYISISGDGIQEGTKVKATASSGKNSNSDMSDFSRGDFDAVGGPSGGFGGGGPSGGGMPGGF